MKSLILLTLALMAPMVHADTQTVLECSRSDGIRRESLNVFRRTDGSYHYEAVRCLRAFSGCDTIEYASSGEVKKEENAPIYNNESVQIYPTCGMLLQFNDRDGNEFLNFHRLIDCQFRE